MEITNNDNHGYEPKSKFQSQMTFRLRAMLLKLRIH